jgi:hypothetical protein
LRAKQLCLEKSGFNISRGPITCRVKLADTVMRFPKFTQVVFAEENIGERPMLTYY